MPAARGSDVGINLTVVVVVVVAPSPSLHELIAADALSQAAQQELSEREPKLQQIVTLAQNVISALQQTQAQTAASTGGGCSSPGPESGAGRSASPASPKRTPPMSTSPSLASLPPAISEEERKKLVTEGSLSRSLPLSLALRRNRIEFRILLCAVHYSIINKLYVINNHYS